MKNEMIKEYIFLNSPITKERINKISFKGLGNDDDIAAKAAAMLTELSNCGVDVLDFMKISNRFMTKSRISAYDSIEYFETKMRGTIKDNTTLCSHIYGIELARFMIPVFDNFSSYLSHRDTIAKLIEENKL